jgi:hypothetical protein
VSDIGLKEHTGWHRAGRQGKADRTLNGLAGEHVPGRRPPSSAATSYPAFVAVTLGVVHGEGEEVVAVGLVAVVRESHPAIHGFLTGLNWYLHRCRHGNRQVTQVSGTAPQPVTSASGHNGEDSKQQDYRPHHSHNSHLSQQQTSVRKWVVLRHLNPRKLSVLLLRLWVTGEIHEPLRMATRRGDRVAPSS